MNKDLLGDVIDALSNYRLLRVAAKDYVGAFVIAGLIAEVKKALPETGGEYYKNPLIGKIT